ncbi:MAG: DUF1836 domain-containing protein [Clostridia bacterium]|nr:DUF1836 domain-containing protein [Clostridia bacterium]
MEKQKNTLPIAARWQDFPDIELYMDQVISVLEKHLVPYFPDEKCITPTMINNYVKQRLILPPQNKRYAKGQLTRLFMICILKSFMQLSDIRLLLENLSLSRTDEELFDLFAAELDGSVKWVIEHITPEKDHDAPTEKVLRASLNAFASIVFARIEFRRAAEDFVPLAEEEEKSEKKEKKDKKEEKKKEKREKK